MKNALLLLALLLFGPGIVIGAAEAGILYQHLPYPSGGFYHSSWWDPDGSNYDQYVWDAWTLDVTADVNSVEWRGAYDPAYGGAGGPVRDFTVAIYASIPAGTQPDVSHPPLVEYTTGGAAGETYAGVFGGVTMYDYRFTLPAAFPATAGVKYWVQIEAWQWGFPDWSLARGQGGEGSHFRCLHVTGPGDNGVPTGCSFATITGDITFTLLTAVATGLDPASAPAALAIQGAVPNPAAGGHLEVSFSLAESAPATLELFDAAGRRVRVEAVGALGAGVHRVDLAPSTPLEPGIYFARLTQGDHAGMAKVIVAP